MFDSVRLGIKEMLSIVRRLSAHREAFEAIGNPRVYIKLLSRSWCPVDKGYEEKWLEHFENLLKKEEKMADTRSLKQKIISILKGAVRASVAAFITALVASIPEVAAAIGPLAVGLVPLIITAGKSLRMKYPALAEWWVV